MQVHEHASCDTVCGEAKVGPILEQYLALSINSMVYLSWREVASYCPITVLICAPIASLQKVV